MHFMNRQRGRHMSGGEEHHGGEHQAKPDIHIKSHSGGHTVHVMHQDGRHEKHEHEDGDTQGIAEHVHELLGNGDQGTGESGGEPRPENEFGSGAAD